MTVKPKTAFDVISAADKTLDFLETYGLLGVIYATREQAEEYVRTHGLACGKEEKAMERITKRCQYGIALKMEYDFVVGTQANYDKVQNVLDRLAAYEDAGLNPEEILGLCEMDKRSRMAQMLRWEAADKDGRLVVLKPEQSPSRDGQAKPDCFYTDKPAKEYCPGYCHYEDEPIEACQECWWCDGNDDFREEAEAALGGEA